MTCRDQTGADPGFVVTLKSLLTSHSDLSERSINAMMLFCVEQHEHSCRFRHQGTLTACPDTEHAEDLGSQADRIKNKQDLPSAAGNKNYMGVPALPVFPNRITDAWGHLFYLRCHAAARESTDFVPIKWFLWEILLDHSGLFQNDPGKYPDFQPGLLIKTNQKSVTDDI